MNENIRLDNSTVFNPQTGEFRALPSILQFTTDKNILIDESPATISWTVSNATVIKLNNETVEPTGTKEFYSTDLLTITLFASNDAGEAEPKTITIDIDRQQPVVHSFKVDAPFAIKGSPITLTWNVEGAKKIEIDNGIGDVSTLNSKTISVGTNGVFNLTAKTHFGIKVSAVAAVTIFPSPIIESLIIPTPDFSSNLKIENLVISKPNVNVGINLKPIPKFSIPTFKEIAIPVFNSQTPIFQKGKPLQAEIFSKP